MITLLPLANHLWQSTAFAALAALLTLALRHNRAPARYWLWFAASLKFLIPFTLLVRAGAWLADRLTSIATTPLPAPSTLSNFFDQVTEPFASTPLYAAPAAPPPLLHLLPALLLILWITGIAVLAASWFTRWRSVRATLRTATPVALSLPVPVLSISVLTSPACLEPGVFGILQPVLLLPDGIAHHLTPAELDAILAHELCHVRRRDNLASAFHMLVEALFWFHPLVWWLGARLLAERERACDEEVLRRGNHPQVYAEGILKICELYLASPLACIAGVTGANLKQRIEEIMTHRALFRLNAARRVLLTTAAALAVAGPLVLGLANAPRILAQTKSAKLTFDVASVKPHPPKDDSFTPPQFEPSGRFLVRAPLGAIVLAAFNLPLHPTVRLAGVPEWANGREGVYDIEATTALPPGLSDKAREDRMRAMLQSLLADRFKMTFHHENKEMPIYALVVAKGGLKLEKADIDEKSCPGPDVVAAEATTLRPGMVPTTCHRISGGQGRGLHARAADMSDLVTYVENWTLGRPLLDKTGIKGLYKLDTKGWQPMQINITPPPAGAKGEDGSELIDMPTLYQVFDKLGLKMESTKDRVPIYVVDHLERPTEN